MSGWDEGALRREIVARGRATNARGVDQGMSGNIAARWGDRVLITPSAAGPTLAKQCCTALPLGEPAILSDAEIADAPRGFATHGRR